MNIAYAATSTFQPAAGINAPIDGTIESENAGWDTAHDATSGFQVDQSGTELIIRTRIKSDGVYNIARSVTLFDTSSIDDTDIISSGTVSLYAQNINDGDNDAQAYITCVGVNLSVGPSSFSTDDFDLVGDAVDNPTECNATAERKDITNISTGAYMDINLNVTGLGFVDKTGYTRLGFREGHDIEDIAINSGNDTYSHARFDTADVSGTNQDPRLIVVHGQAIVLEKRKSVDEPQVGNPTLQNDDGLELTLAANKNYIIEGAIFASSTNATPDIKIAFGIPSDAEMHIGYLADSPGITADAELIRWNGKVSGRIAIDANVPTVIHVEGTVKTGASVGDFVLKWVQFASCTSATVVAAGSYLEANEI